MIAKVYFLDRPRYYTLFYYLHKVKKHLAPSIKTEFLPDFCAESRAAKIYGRDWKGE